LYSERLAVLKKEIAIILQKKTKKLNTNQKIMYKFIQGKTDKAEFNINGQIIILFSGDDKKGFRHIIEKHYKSNDLEAMDILNIIDVFKSGMKLNEEGVSNNNLEVYMSLKKQKEHRLVLKKVEKNTWIVTFYRKT
jgi:hypothetical protein